MAIISKIIQSQPQSQLKLSLAQLSLNLLNFFWQFQPIFGVCLGSKHILGTTYVVEQLSFSILHSILTFECDLILGLFLHFFLVLMVYFWVRKGSKTILGIIHVV